MLYIYGNRFHPKMLGSTSSHQKKQQQQQQQKTKKNKTKQNNNYSPSLDITKHFGCFSANSLNRAFRYNEPSI